MFRISTRLNDLLALRVKDLRPLAGVTKGKKADLVRAALAREFGGLWDSQLLGEIEGIKRDFRCPRLVYALQSFLSGEDWKRPLPSDVTYASPQSVGPTIDAYRLGARDSLRRHEKAVEESRVLNAVQRLEFHSSHKPSPPKENVPMKKPTYRNGQGDYMPLITIRKRGEPDTHVPWGERFSKLLPLTDALILYPCFKKGEPVEHAKKVLCPEGIPVYGVNKDHRGEKVFFDNGGTLSLFPFEGMRVLTYPLDHPWSWVEEGGDYVPKVDRDSPFSEDEKKVLLRHLGDVVASKQVYHAEVGENSVTVVVGPKPSDGSDPWESHLAKDGVTLAPGPKTGKRAAQLNTFYAAVMRFHETHVRLVVEDDLPAVVGDGACFISRTLSRTLSRSALTKRRQKDVLRAKWGTFRAVVPESLGGGMIKARAYVVPDHLIPGGGHVWTHPANVKPEVRGADKWVIAFTPDNCKPKSGYTSTQAMIVHRALFPEDKVRTWVTSYVNDVLLGIKENTLVQRLDDLMSGLEEKEDVERYSVYASRKWAAMTLAVAGLGLEHSVTTLNGVYDGVTRKMTRVNRKGEREDRLNLPIPCSRYCPVLPQGFLQKAGYLLCVPEGKGLYHDHLNVLVVHDRDWEKLVYECGGADADDNFYVLYRTDVSSGKRKLFVYRSPCAEGEYYVLTPMDEGDCPVTELVLEDKGTFTTREVTWPKADFSLLPDPVSRQVAEGRLTFTLPKEKGEGEAYTRESVGKKVLLSNARVRVGVGVNAYMLAFISNLGLKEFPCRMEQVVDACTQTHDRETQVKVCVFADAVLREVCEKQLPVDTIFAGHRVKRLPEECSLVTEDGWLTRLHRHVDRERERGRAWLTRNIKLKTPPCLLDYAVSDEVEGVFREHNRMYRSLTLDRMKGWVYEELGALGMDMREAVAQFARLIHERPKADGSRRSDWLLTSGSLWKEYREVLVEGRKREDVPAVTEDVVI